MSLFRREAWRSHPLLKYGIQHMLIGLPTGIAMFATVKVAEKTGLLTCFEDKTDPKKYEFVSAVYGAPPAEGHGHGTDSHGSGSGHGEKHH